MKKKKPYDVIKSRYVTEKAAVLQGLQHATSNPCVTRCSTPKYLFLVDKRANKKEIAEAVEEIYAVRGVKVTGVNTIMVRPKFRKVRGREGFRAGFKKAIVSLTAGDTLDETV